MANTLNKTGITTGNTVEAYHVTQSIDAFTGTAEYDIILSGSFTMTGSITMDGSLIIPKDTGSGYIIEAITRTTKQTVSIGNATSIIGHPSGSGIYPGSTALIGLKNLTNTIEFELGPATESIVGDQYEFIITNANAGVQFLSIEAASGSGDIFIAKIFGADNTNQFNNRTPVITRISTGAGNAQPGDRITLTNIDDSGVNRAWYVEAFVSGAAGYILD